jgi:putative membrane protein
MNEEIDIHTAADPAVHIDVGTAADPAVHIDVGTELAHQRTDLALERNYMAAERTLMAWIRTALSMISFGFTIAKLGQAMHDVEVKKLLGGFRIVGVRRIGYFLVILGTLALFGAAMQHWRRAHELHAMGLPRRIGITFIVAVALVVLGVLAFTSLVSEF